MVELATRPMIKDSEVTDDLLERARIRGYEAIDRLEDLQTFKVINAACPSDHKIKTLVFNAQSLIDAMTCIQDHELQIGSITMRRGNFNVMCEWGHKDFIELNPEFTVKLPEDNPLKKTKGTFKNIPVYVSSVMPRDTIFVLAKKEYVGHLSIKCDGKEIKVSDSESLKQGWIISKEMGFCVVQDYGVAKITTGNYLMTDLYSDVDLINESKYFSTELHIDLEVNGKFCDRIEISSKTTNEELLKLAHNNIKVKQSLNNIPIVKEIIVPKQFVNIITKPIIKPEEESI